MKPLIIPFFIPNQGCPQRCVFCDAFIASDGVNEAVTQESFTKKINLFLDQNENLKRPVEIAFYGGSFNWLDNSKRNFYSNLVKPLLKNNKIEGTRVSLRPDKIDEKIINELLEIKTKVVELGVQSMNDGTLMLVERGHSRRHVEEAFDNLRRANIQISAHVMVGLPGETEKDFFDSFNKLLSLKPDYLRMHPTLVIEGTALHKSFERKEYAPLSLEKAKEICAKAYILALKNKVKVVRVGLQANEALNSSKVFGPYHPSFGEMVISGAILVQLLDILNTKNYKTVDIKVNPKALSKVKGLRNKNIEQLEANLGFKSIKIESCDDLSLNCIEINNEKFNILF